MNHSFKIISSRDVLKQRGAYTSIFLLALCLSTCLTSTFCATARHLHAQQQDTETQVRMEGIAASIQSKKNRGQIQKVILLSDVDLLARLKQLEIIAALPNPSAPWPPLTLQEKKAALDEIVSQILLAQEAERTQIPIPTLKETTETIQQFKKTAGSNQVWSLFLKRMEASTSELEDLSSRKAWAQKFLEQHLKSLNLFPEVKLRAVYDSGMHPFIGQTFEEAKEVLRVWLLRQNLDQALAELVTSLKSKAQIRIYAPYP